MTSCAADQEPRAAKQLCRHVVDLRTWLARVPGPVHDSLCPHVVPARLVALADLLWIDSQGVPWHDVIVTLHIKCIAY